MPMTRRRFGAVIAALAVMAIASDEPDEEPQIRRST